MKYCIQGFLIGLAYVAPLGTQNLFVINSALTQSRKRVLLTAIIVAFFDVTLSLACFFGIGAVISAFKWVELVIVLVGALVVIYLGIGLVRTKEATLEDVKVDIPIRRVIATACVVTWFNPQAIIDGTMLLGASKATVPIAYGTEFIISCAMASVCWWLGMSTVVSNFKTKISGKVLQMISQGCGVFIIFYGCKLLYSGVEIIINL